MHPKQGAEAPKPSFSSPPETCQAQTRRFVSEQKWADIFAIALPQWQHPLATLVEYFEGFTSPTRQDADRFLPVDYDTGEVAIDGIGVVATLVGRDYVGIDGIGVATTLVGRDSVIVDILWSNVSLFPEVDILCDSNTF